MLFVQSELEAKRAHLVRYKETDTNSSSSCNVHLNFLKVSFSSSCPDCLLFYQLVRVCECVRVCTCTCIWYVLRTRGFKHQSEDISECEDMLAAPHTSKGLSVRTEGWGLRVQLESGWVKLEQFSVCVFESDSVHMCFGLCVHPERMAQRQMQADNILRETLQCCILTSNCSNVYSNQRHNRWRGMNLWQAGMSYSSFTCGFWCLMTASQKELTHLSVSCIKEVLSAAVNVLRAQPTCAEMHALILLKRNLHTKNPYYKSLLLWLLFICFRSLHSNYETYENVELSNCLSNLTVSHKT